MKIALVTGASRGIGKSIAINLSKEGFHVLINYKSNQTAAQSVIQEIKEAGGSAEPLPFDVSDREQTLQALDNWAKENEGAKIEALVNNAGIRKDNLMVWLEPSEWDDVMNTNLNSFYNVTKPLLQNMILNKWGRIVNIVSLSGIKGLPGQVNYSAAKGAVIAATKSLAQELGRKKITVNAVAPGFIKTEMLEGLNEKELKKMVPLNRFGEAQEVADLVTFLCSEKASYITGEIISINGGLYT